MLKKIIISFILIAIAGRVYAKEVEISVYSPVKITTSNLDLKEGDRIEFETVQDTYLNSKLYLKKDEKTLGVITSLEDNGFCCKEAAIYAENFRIKNVDGKTIKLNGIIYKKGRTHWMFTQFLPIIPELIRGGEVQITEKDRFNLYIEDNL